MTAPVTFLFTDIEGSTRLWEQDPARMRAALERHNALLHVAIAEYGGEVFKTVGDAFCAAFENPADAVRAAEAAQRALLQQVPEVRVRMAIHTGEAEAVRGDYLGPALNRVSRLLMVGHGGQILLSQTAAEAVRAAVAGEMALRQLGTHQLRDLEAKETIFQLQPPDLPARFPPLNTLELAQRRGAVRMGGLGLAVVVLVGTLAVTAARERDQARHDREAERSGRYRAEIGLAQQGADAGNLARAAELLEADRPRPGEPDLRGWEWRYLWGRTRDQSRCTFSGHRGGVYSVAVSPDHHLLASAGADRTVRLWELATKREVARLQGHVDWVTTVAFSPDGRTLASGGKEGLVILWDPATGSERARIDEAHIWVNAVAFSADGKQLAVGLDDGTVRLYDAWSQKETGRTESEGSGVRDIVFIPNRRAVALLSDAGVSLWEPAGRSRLLFRPDVSLPACLALSPDGSTLLCGGEGGIEGWDLVRGRPVAAVGDAVQRVRAVAFSPDGQRVVVGGLDSRVTIWDVASWTRSSTLVGHRMPVTAVRFTGSGELVTCSMDGTAKAWDLQAARPADSLPARGGSVPSLAFVPGSDELLTGSRDGRVRLWSAAGGTGVAALAAAADQSLFVAVSPDGRLAASAGAGPTVRVWDLSTGQLRWTLTGHAAGVTGLDFLPNGRTLAAVSAGWWSNRTSEVALWDMDTGQARGLLPTGPLKAIGQCFSRDLLALALAGGGVQVWNLSQGRRVGMLPPGTTPLGWMAFAPDGRLLAAVADDNSIHLWDLAAAESRATLVVPEGAVGPMAFSPDGHLLAVASGRSVALFDPASPYPLLSLTGPAETVLPVAFSGDGSTLAAGCLDGSVHLWHAPAFAETDAQPDTQRR